MKFRIFQRELRIHALVELYRTTRYSSLKITLEFLISLLVKLTKIRDTYIVGPISLDMTRTYIMLYVIVAAVTISWTFIGFVD